MHPLTWFDNRTLLVCQCLLEVIFCCVLFAFHRAYPALRGARTMSLAFVIAILGTLLLAMRGHASVFLSVVLGNLLIYAALLLLYRGLLLFFDEKRYFTFSLIVVAIASALQVYYALVDDRIVLRIIFICLAMCILTWLKSWTLLVHANRLTHRLLFSAALFVSGLVNLSRAALTILHGAPKDYMQHDAIQTYNLMIGLAWVALQGVFYLSLVYFDLTSNMESRASRDSLTGTLNRRGIEQKLTEELARSHTADTAIALLLIDLDLFKSINDIHGHGAGDKALRLVAASIASVLRPYDHLGRYGGDEFLLILPETSGETAMHVAERIREALTGMSATAQLPPITLSIGVTWFERDEDLLAIIARADAALYEAKRSGRNCARFQPPPHNTSTLTRPFTLVPRPTLLRRVTSRRRAPGNTP